MKFSIGRRIVPNVTALVIITISSIFAISIFVITNERNVYHNNSDSVNTSAFVQKQQSESNTVANNDYDNNKSITSRSLEDNEIKYYPSSPLLPFAYTSSDSHSSSFNSNDADNNKAHNGTSSIKNQEINATSLKLSQEADIYGALSRYGYSDSIIDLKMINSLNSHSNDSIKIIISLSKNGDLSLFECEHLCTSANSWSLESHNFANLAQQQQRYQDLDRIGSRPFDAIFEQSSGRLIIVYTKQSTASQFYYRIFDPSNNNISPEHITDYNSNGAINRTNTPIEASGEIRYFKIAAKSESNELALAIEVINPKTSEESVYAFKWDPVSSKFENQLTVDSSKNLNRQAKVEEEEPFDITFEKSSGAIVAITSINQDNIKIMRFFNGAWNLTSISDSNPNNHNTAKFVAIAANPSTNSDKIMACVEDDLFDLSCTEINGGHIAKWFLLESNMNNAKGKHFDFAWDLQGTKGILVWMDSHKLNLRQWSEETKTWKNIDIRSYYDKTGICPKS